jgi:hypothetical protein
LSDRLALANAIAVVLIGIILAALRYLPPGHSG